MVVMSTYAGAVENLCKCLFFVGVRVKNRGNFAKSV